MPFTPVQAPKCKRCGKSVYQAEEAKDSDGGVWHKSPCFSCGECKKKLDSTSLNMHEGKKIFQCNQYLGFLLSIV